MVVHVKVFGQLTDITGLGGLVLNGYTSTDEVLDHLKYTFPELANKSFSIALDKRIISKNEPITGDSVLALLPPFSGG